MSTVISSFAQKISGDGNVVKETRSLTSFNKIESDGVVNVILIQSGSEFAEVETDKNLQQIVVTSVKDNTLTITTKKDSEIENSTKLNVYVNFKDIKSLELNSVGNIKSQGQLKLSKLDIENNSVGNIDLNLDCNTLEIENNSVGNTTLTGNVDNCIVELNSVGNLSAFDLVAQTLVIESNAVGNAEVNSVKEISISQNGMGNIVYKGDAVVKKLEKSGLGNVKKE
ncbi:MAG TPA: head GIN domain-containing protein [Ignavibacteria bacterium]|nr:head GIN domain-containing protein [Ignavibacteria bacterium]